MPEPVGFDVGGDLGNFIPFCQPASTIIETGGSVINNSDGTISVFVMNSFTQTLTPVHLSKPCCEALNIPGSFFDIDTQKCRWSSVSRNCSLDSVFKLVLNPKGNDGSFFYVDGDEDCYLQIDFDYLFKFDCNSLKNLLPNVIARPSVSLSTGNSPRGGTTLVGTPVNISPTLVQSSGVRCQQLQNQLDNLNSQLATTFYSIVCEAVPVSPRFSTPASNLSFQNTGFGLSTDTGNVSGVAPLSFALPTTRLSNQTYCLTEPAGLNHWARILGPNRYQRFLDGDATSYTCVDVQTMVVSNQGIINANLNSPRPQPLYINACNTPFGAKTQLLKNIQSVTQQLSDCLGNQAALESLPSIAGPVIASADPLNNARGGAPIVNTQNTSVSGICSSPIQALENLDISITLDVIESSISGDTLTTVYEGPLFPKIGNGNLYNYVTTHTGGTGFYICGDPINGDPSNLTSCTPMNFNGPSTSNVYNCNQLKAVLESSLFSESGLPNTPSGHTTFNNNVGNDAFISQWLHFSSIINNPTILEQIKNKKIKISIKINDACVDFCILLDSIQLEKICSVVEKNEIFVTKSPGFSLEKIRDNKKSWLNNTSRVHREFDIRTYNGLNPIRPTDYYPNDERLVINTKEIDLDMGLASAIETDVWCYLKDNECLLTAITEPCACTITGASSASTVALGGLQVENDMVSFGNPYQFFTGSAVSFEQDFIVNLVVGKYYKITYTISNMTGGSVGISMFLAGSAVSKFDQKHTSNGTYSLTKKYLGTIGTNVFCVNEQSSSPLTIITVTSLVELEVSEGVCCGDDSVDYSSLLTQPLSAITVVEDFEYFMVSELIDAKDRKTLSAYPTLRGLYDRYLNSSAYCSTNSSAFDYETMDQFSKLVGTYWVDIVEQVVPATTIWGSSKVYSNTIFDNQKFKYKAYTLLLGGNLFSGYTLPSPTTACTSGVSAVTTTIGSTNATNTHNYSQVCIAQMNSGSEFIGTVAVVGNVSGPFNPNSNPNYQVINEV